MQKSTHTDNSRKRHTQGTHGEKIFSQTNLRIEKKEKICNINKYKILRTILARINSLH